MNIAQALTEFYNNISIPDSLICDLAAKQTGPQSPTSQAIQ